jgi:opacity protein-like surface antigen
MKMTNTFRSLSLLGLCALGALPGAFGQSPTLNRAWYWEFSLLGQYWTTDNVLIKDVTLPTGILPGAPTATSDLNYELDDTDFWGFGLAYNFNDRFALRSEFAFGQPNYKMTWNGSQLTGRAYIHTGKFNVDFNLTNTAFCPYFSAGVGYNYLDTGVPSGPPEIYIWWDYYWNIPYVVAVQPTFSETTFTYNVAAGVRWDLSPSSVLRFTVTNNWIDSSNAGGMLTTLEATLSYGWKW